MKIPRLGVTQHFADKVYWVLDLAISIWLPLSMTMGVLTTLLVANI
jgi:hypothetical protein